MRRAALALVLAAALSACVLTACADAAPCGAGAKPTGAVSYTYGPLDVLRTDLTYEAEPGAAPGGTIRYEGAEYEIVDSKLNDDGTYTVTVEPTGRVAATGEPEGAVRYLNIVILAVAALIAAVITYQETKPLRAAIADSIRRKRAERGKKRGL